VEKANSRSEGWLKYHIQCIFACPNWPS